MKRREFIGLAAGAAALPISARAQQPVMPVIGFLDSRSPEALMDRLRGFRQGLKQTGYTEGDNTTLEYRWAENQIDRLPVLAADLVRRRVIVIIASGGIRVALAAKVATTTIPIVIITAEDPVKLGLVASLSRPGGNLTGINFFNSELVAKRLELLRELLPQATRLAVIVDPADATNTETTLRDLEPAAGAVGLQILVLGASTSREIDLAFETIAREKPNGVFVGQSPFLNARRVQLVQLAARHGVPATYAGREFTEIGGLMSYGSNITDAYRQVGVYAGRILKGAKSAELPVVQANKFELVINHQTARILGLTVPDKLLATADEVIE